MYKFIDIINFQEILCGSFANPLKYYCSNCVATFKLFNMVIYEIQDAALKKNHCRVAQTFTLIYRFCPEAYNERTQNKYLKVKNSSREMEQNVAAWNKK